jgi:hypothetical protein
VTDQVLSYMPRWGTWRLSISKMALVPATGHFAPRRKHSRVSNLAELTLGEIEKLLDEVAEMGVSELLLTGGEPLDRPDLPAILSLIRDRAIS